MEPLKRLVKIYVNIGLFVILIGAFFASGVSQLPDNDTKLILSSVAVFVILFGIVAWDITSGINIIEQKVKDIEDKLGK